MSGSITQWLGQLKAGEADAARLLWERYAQQLTAAVRRKIPHRLRPVADEEDITQSVFAAFWNNAGIGKLGDLSNRDELWWYLLSATKQKIVDRVRTETALKRSGRPRPSDGIDGEAGEPEVRRRFHELVSSEPAPEFVVMLEEEQRRLMALLRDDQWRQIATWRMAGDSVEEIAARLDIAPRSVTRKLGLIRKTWEKKVDQ